MGGHFANHSVGTELLEAKLGRIVTIGQPLGIAISIGPCIIVPVVATVPCAVGIDCDGVAHFVAHVLTEVVEHLNAAHTPQRVVGRVFEIGT